MEQYWYQMYMDDLPLVGVVGEMRDGGKALLWTHKKFEVLHNGDKIVGVSLSASDSVEVVAGSEITFTYEV